MSDTKVLDCETLESTYRSVEGILGIGETDLNAIFDDADLEEGYYIADRLLEQVQQSAPTIFFDEVCWFHLTRVAPDTSFSEGILPLQSRVNEIWEILYSLTCETISKSEWDNFRQQMDLEIPTGKNNNCNNAHRLYRMKTNTAQLGGPFAMLIRETGFIPKQIDNHDYLKIPEIVEDICNFFECNYEQNLTEKFMSATIPCIVKFTSDQVSPDYLSTALFYLYCKRRGRELSRIIARSFNANGTAIPPNRIISIEEFRSDSQYP